MKKFLALLLVMVLCVGAGVAGTIAYLKDSDSDVNIMTVGNVYIEQIEQERAADGSLQDFTPAKPANPAVGPIEWADEKLDVNGTEYKVFTEELKNVVDKIVTVKNTGSEDAFVRTVIAIEAPGFDQENLIHINYNIDGLNVSDAIEVAIEKGGEKTDYCVFTFTYTEALKAGAISAPSLLQVFLDSKAGNEDVAKFGATWDILVLSQAVQADGFADAKTALDTAFGEATAAKVAEWFSGDEFAIPTVFSYEGVNYLDNGTKATASSAGEEGTTVYRGVFSDGKTSATEVEIGEGITRLNNRAFCKAPTITSVTLPDSLTYIDESVFQQSGITEIEIPENVTYIGKQAFGACGSLEKIVINAKNVTIANYVARACANLKEVYIYSDSVTFESGSMYFTNKENGDASGITFYVKDQAMAENLYSAFSTSHSYGLLIKSLDGATEYYNTLK